ncbi:MAG: 4Fe-4S binding protein [Spirochaetaceae bacterium]|nr:4Fe-4S binding protein [Spirochaetaceae bacterium]
MKKQNTLRFVRWTILLAILILTTVMGRMHQIIKLYPPIDAFCPFGGLESLWALFRYQVLLKKIAWSSVILLLTSVGTALIFRRSFCGNICPLGFLQELFGMAGHKFFSKRFNLPPRADRILRYVKYVVLIFFLALSWKTLTLVISPFDPWVAYHHIGTDELFTKNLIGAIVLFSTMGLSILSDRPFCRYLCPMGGFLALVSKIGFLRIKRDDEKCIDCGACDLNCPAGLEISKKIETKSVECINCSECINTCPIEDTLYYSTPAKRHKPIKVSLILFGTLAIFVSVLSITSLTKQFVWKADTGLEKNVERLLYGPEKIHRDNQMIHIVQIFQIHPLYLKEQFKLESEDDYYKSFEELGIEVEDVQDLIYRVYDEAGLDPTQLLGGGKGCGGEDH